MLSAVASAYFSESGYQALAPKKTEACYSSMDVLMSPLRKETPFGWSF